VRQARTKKETSRNASPTIAQGWLLEASTTSPNPPSKVPHSSHTCPDLLNNSPVRLH
jgi:hypothetical protein